MTFYQELQLNQAGSKNLLKKSETVKEKSYIFDLLIINQKIGSKQIGLVFCIIRHIVECIILHTWVGFIFMVIVLVVVMQIFEKVKEQLLKWTID